MQWVKGFPKITSELELEPWFQVLYCSQDLFPYICSFHKLTLNKKGYKKKEEEEVEV